MKLFNRLVYLFSISILLIAMIDTVQATTESLNVKAGEELVRKISISAEDHIRITFTALSPSSGSMRFWIVFPNGTIGDDVKSSNYDISFVSAVQGECEMHFSNTDTFSDTNDRNSLAMHSDRVYNNGQICLRTRKLQVLKNDNSFNERRKGNKSSFARPNSKQPICFQPT
jgi:hypothetical protein